MVYTRPTYGDEETVLYGQNSCVWSSEDCEASYKNNSEIGHFGKIKEADVSDDILAFATALAMVASVGRWSPEIWAQHTGRSTLWSFFTVASICYLLFYLFLFALTTTMYANKKQGHSTKYLQVLPVESLAKIISYLPETDKRKIVAMLN
jgi:hypothetical protein